MSVNEDGDIGAAVVEGETEQGVMSDAEWDEWIDSRIEAHKQGVCDPKTCAQCLEPGDPLERWLS